MKGIPGRQKRGIPTGARLDCIDNTGAKIVQVVSVPKYERYEKRTSRYLAHSPPCFQVKIGDELSIMECRPLSKRVSYVVIENKK